MKLYVWILLWIGFALAADFSQLHHMVAQYQNNPLLQHAQWSLYARYEDNGEVVLDEQSTLGLAPASGLKVFTTVAALDYLGEDYRFQTRLYYDGQVHETDGVLQGDLYIRGGGDPTLGSSTVKGSLTLDSLMMQWSAAIQEAGIQEIKGAVVADANIFSGNSVPDNWMWVDLGNYYGAGVSGLTVHDNLYRLYFHPAAKAGLPAEVLGTIPMVKGLHFSNFMMTGKRGSGDQGYIYCAPGQNQAVLRGTVPAGRDSFFIKGSIPDPPLFLARYLTDWLNSRGIRISGKARVLPERINKEYDPGKRIVTTYSPPLAEIIYMLNKRSINLYAEHLLRTLAVSRGKKGTEPDGIKILLNFLKKEHVPTNGVHLDDGCGLSRTDMITTRSMVDLLSVVRHKSYFRTFFKSLGIAGDATDIGYFADFGRKTEIAKNAHIKSGLIQGVRSHSGYLKDKAGRLIVFSLIANNFTCSYHKIDGIHQNILVELARLK